MLRPSPQALITGATDGLGLALARRLERSGWTLWLLGRRPLESLQDPIFARHSYLCLDLSQPPPQGGLPEIARLDLLVHNAAIGLQGACSTHSPASQQELLRVNLEAPIWLTQLYLEALLRARGKVAFITSIASQLPAPRIAAYAASKAALEGFARSLRSEMGHRLQVQVIRPGPIRTAMHQKVGLNPQEIPWHRFPSVESVAAQLETALSQSRPATALGLKNLAICKLGQVPGLMEWALKCRGALEPLPKESPRKTARALVTGSSSGIGLALTQALTHRGWSVTGLDSQPPQQPPSGGFLLWDLSRADIAEALMPRLADAQPFDLVIHSAGVNSVGPFQALPWESQQQVLRVNFQAPLCLTSALLSRGLLARGGRLVFIASLSHFLGYPGASTYAASKDGLVSLARSLGVAMGAGRKTLVVYPGPTRTPHARRYSPDNRHEHRRMLPERVAKEIIQALDRGQAHLVPGWRNRLAALLGWLFPEMASRLMRRWLYLKIESRPVERVVNAATLG